MSNTSYVRKSTGLVSSDINALREAKSKKAHAEKIDRIERKIDQVIEQLQQLHIKIEGESNSE